MLCFEYGIELDDVVRQWPAGGMRQAARQHARRVAALQPARPLRARRPAALGADPACPTPQTSEKELLRKEKGNTDAIEGASEEVGFALAGVGVGGGMGGGQWQAGQAGTIGTQGQAWQRGGCET